MKTEAAAARSPAYSFGKTVLGLLIAALASCTCDAKVATPVPEDAAERYAEAVCEAAARCGCVEESFSGSIESCQQDRVERFDAIAGWPGMAFDRDCFEARLEWLENDDCATVDEYHEDFPPVLSTCRVFRGTLDAGQACAPALYEPGGDVLSVDPDNGGLTVGPCKVGLVCYAGRCMSPADQERVAEGESCRLSLGVRCEGADGYYCASDGACRERSALGESCDSPYGCHGFNDTAYCSGLSLADENPGTCATRIQTGEPCDPQSATSPCAGNFSYCGNEAICVEQWPAACHMVADRPGAYNAEDWIPI